MKTSSILACMGLMVSSLSLACSGSNQDTDLSGPSSGDDEGTGGSQRPTGRDSGLPFGEEGPGNPDDPDDPTNPGDGDPVDDPGSDAGARIDAPAPPPPEPKEPLNLTFTGDVMAHEVNYTRKPYDAIYTDVASLFKGDDFSFANLEFPIDDDKPLATFPMFNIHTDYVQSAIKAGLEVFSNANNHACDQGEDSVLATMASMKKLKTQSNISYTGLREDPSQTYVTLPLSARGWKIGFLAVTSYLNVSEGAKYVQRVTWRTASQRKSLLDFIKREASRYDLYILSFHGGTEYAKDCPDDQKDLFYDLIKAGVSILWAHHPHVLQPWERVTYNKSTRLIMYSTGNLISGQGAAINPVLGGADQDKAATMISAIFQVGVESDGTTVAVKTVKPVLTANYIAGDSKPIVVRQLEPLVKDASVPWAWQGFYKTWLARAKETVKERPVVALQ